MEKIPATIKYSCPEKCPVCGKECAAVFRIWKPSIRKVVCDFIHKQPSKESIKYCTKTYDY